MATLLVQCEGCGGNNRVAASRVAQAKCGRCQAPLTPSHPLDVDDQAFDALVAASEVPVIVDLWSPTCGPCLRVAPDVKQLAKAHAGELIVAKIDVSKHGQVAQRLGVRGVPTFAVFQQGKAVRQQAGAMRLAQLEAFVGPYLSR